MSTSSLTEDQINDIAFELFKPPFVYSGGHIFDSVGNAVGENDGRALNAILVFKADERYKHLDQIDDINEALGKHIAEALTDHWKGRWITWDGNGNGRNARCPVNEMYCVEFVLRGGGVGTRQACNLTWEIRGTDDDIVRYRVISTNGV
jgi:hypothetical protein